MPRKTATAAARTTGGLHASMRPRPDAAENPIPVKTVRRRLFPGFNEAAARCRGKRRILSRAIGAQDMLQ